MKLEDDRHRQLRATQRALGMVLPFVNKRQLSRQTRQALFDAGVKITLRDHRCPATNVKEQDCNCGWHVDKDNDAGWVIEGENGALS